MPGGKQGQPQGRQNGGAGGPTQGMRDQVKEAGQQIRQGAESVGQHVQESYGAAQEAVGRQYRRVEGMAARNPSQSILIGFGVGFGLGVLLTVALTQREESSWYERTAPDALQDLPSMLRNLPDKITEAISRNLPRSMRHHLG